MNNKERAKLARDLTAPKGATLRPAKINPWPFVLGVLKVSAWVALTLFLLPLFLLLRVTWQAMTSKRGRRY